MSCNNVVNFHESTTIWKFLYENVWNLIESTTYIYFISFNKIETRLNIWQNYKWLKNVFLIFFE